MAKMPQAPFSLLSSVISARDAKSGLARARNAKLGTAMPKRRAAKNEDQPIVIQIGKKKCPPIIGQGFPTMAAARQWLAKTHCQAPCKDNGSMIIGFSDEGNYTAIRFCA